MTGLRVRFWGVRGSFPTPAASHLGYGGNTSCIEISADSGARFIVDAGTGLRDLGLAMQSSAVTPETIRLLLTHFHGDHVQGLPFFMPLYDAGQRIAFYSGYPPLELKTALEGAMIRPYFPVQLADLPGRREFFQIKASGEEMEGVRVKPFRLNHPQGAWGFRMERGQASVVHAFDYEHGSDEHERDLIEHCRGAGLLIYDAQYTPGEYPERQGWGHSTWAEAVRIAGLAGVKRLMLFHHDPSHDDAAIDEILARARLEFPSVEAAREGMMVEVSG